MKLNLENNVSGWVLLEARLGRHRQYSFPSLSIRRRSDLSRTEEIVLPILRDGWIIELIELPDDVAELVCRLPENEQPRDPGFTLRRVGWIERNLRMVNRVLWTYGDLSRDGRREIGLSLPKSIVFNRPLAYRLANEYGPKLQERPYPIWSARFNAPCDRDRAKIVTHVAHLATRPRFHVLIATDDSGPDAVRTTLTSLQRQLYGNFTCTVLDKAGSCKEFLHVDAHWKQTGLEPQVVAQDAVGDWLTAFNDSLSGEKVADWVMLLRAGDALPEHSLYWFACEVLARPESAILYSDDDELDSAGRPSHPRFKSDWSLAHLRSTHYIGDAVVLRGGAVAEAGGVTLDCLRHGNYDLLLRTIDAVGERVGHIPAVLLHRRDGGTRFKAQGTPHGATRDAWEDPAWCLSKLTEHLAREGIEAEVAETLVRCRRIRYRLPETVPLISIIVPTRDAMALLRQCVESVLEKTTYPAFELLVVDNQSTEPEALSYLDGLAGRSAARVLRYDRPFNYSAINNFAAREAKGEILCLLNNDTEVISPDWLEEMVGHLVQPQVGAVGARLLYPDGRVQHGGVTVGPGGCADHLHAELPRGHPGYCQRAVIAQELSAVTAACMLTWKRLYEELGGLNEHALPVAFNDVDYCLRLRDAGYRVIYTPHAELYHHESGSRGIDTTRRERRRARREIKYMRTRWREHMKHDPYYNPNLSYDQPNFTLNWKPRIAKPWE
jgi:GT2 family glycosyltransferase